MKNKKLTTILTTLSTIVFIVLAIYFKGSSKEHIKKEYIKKAKQEQRQRTNRTSNNTTEEIPVVDAEQFLQRFYDTYRSGNYTSPERDRMLSRSLKKALKSISDYESATGMIVLDTDPFINAQDIVGGLYSGDFEISVVDAGSNVYRITYEGGGGEVQIILHLTEENGELRIGDVAISDQETVISLSKQL